MGTVLIIDFLKSFLVSQLVKFGDKIDWGKFCEDFCESAKTHFDAATFSVEREMQAKNFIREFASNFEAKEGRRYIGTSMLAEVVQDSLGTGPGAMMSRKHQDTLAGISVIKAETRKDAVAETAVEEPEEKSFFKKPKSKKKKGSKTA